MIAAVFDTIGHFGNSLSIISDIVIVAIIMTGVLFNVREGKVGGDVPSPQNPPSL
jgi:hypothetical protein